MQLQLDRSPTPLLVPSAAHVCSARGAARKRSPTSVGAHCPSPLLVRWATRYFTRYLKSHFFALRMLGTAPILPPGPAIVYLNHPSWHDPLACFFLARTFFPTRTHHAPIEAAALQRYRFLSRLGLFPLDPHSRRGAADFLRTAATLLASHTGTLWITPEGRFTDPRARPTTLRPGLAHLARLVPQATLLPLALDYTFWNQPRPELLLAFGNPVALPAGLAPADTTVCLAQALERTQDALAVAAQSRDPARFTLLLRGRHGIHPVYDAWRSFIARLTGRSFSPDHF